MIRVLHGQDEFSIEEELSRLRELVGPPELRDPNTTVFEGDGMKMAEVIGAASAMPFLADRRMVIVRGLLERADARGSSASQEWRNLPDALSEIPATTELVFVDIARLRRGGRGIRLAGPNAEVREFPELRRQNLDSWIRDRFTHYDAMAEPAAVSRLSALVGGNLRMLDQEVRKLSLYADGRIVTAQDVNEMVTEAREANIFAAIDAVLERRPERAMRLLYTLLEGGTTVANIIGLMARQVRIALLAGHLMGMSLQRDEIGRRIGVTNAFALDKTIRQSSRFSRAYLMDTHRRLLSADLAIKSGQLGDRLALEILVGRLSAG